MDVNVTTALWAPACGFWAVGIVVVKVNEPDPGVTWFVVGSDTPFEINPPTGEIEPEVSVKLLPVTRCVNFTEN
jgi:hypothetical protein